MAYVLHSLSVAVFLHDDMSVRLSVALIKKKWKSIVPIIPVGPGRESANGSANPFWHVQHKPQCHSGHLPILAAFPLSLYLSLSHTHTRRITAADNPSSPHISLWENISVLLLWTLTEMYCECVLRRRGFKETLLFFMA